MKLSIVVPLVLFALPASAQLPFVETFDNGSNVGSWSLGPPNDNPSSGGNPDWYLRLDNLSGPATCHFLEISTTVWPSAYSGNYRAQGVTSLGLDVNIVAGRFGGEWSVILGNDGGTPGDDNDDCRLIYTSTQTPPLGTGWTSFDFPVDSQSAVLPPGWTVDGACGGNAAWDATRSDGVSAKVAVAGSTNARDCRWVMATPFGAPVEPLV